MAGKSKAINLQFKDFHDGINTADPRVTVGSRYAGRDKYDSRNGWKQVVEATDFLLNLKRPRPGNTGFCDTFTARLKGLGVYLRTDGTEYLLAVSGGKLYSVNTSTGALTELYDLTGLGEAWVLSYFDKAFVCNGTGTCVLEGATARQMHIAAPTGVTAAAVAGGTLPDGLYKLYVSYSIGEDFFSTGLSVSDVTCSGGSNTIRFSDFAQSADGQVTKKIVWMTNAAGSVWYFYGSADNDGTTTVDIASAGDRNTNLVYSVEAHYNHPTPAFQYIKAHNNYLYGSVDTVLYRSLQAGNAYDLRRFNTSATGNKATYPFKIEGIFAIGADLYLNTVGGIIKVPGGDYNAQIDIKQGYFDYPRSVVEWNAGLLGWTKQGLRFFDGQKFVPVDISRDVSTIHGKIVSGAGSDNMPAGCIVRDNDRTEYHLGFCDRTVGTLTNNRGMVLNLDALYFTNDNKAHAVFELWTRGFNHMVTTIDNTYYGGQSHNTKSIVFKKYPAQNKDLNMYAGDTLGVARAYGWSMQTPTILPSLTGRIRCLTLWVHASLTETLYANVVMDKYPIVGEVHEMSAQTLTRFGTGRFGEDRFTSEGPIDQKNRLEASLKGKAVYVRFYQTEADDVFQLIDSILTCSLKEGRFA